jgi:manganese transport protein
MKRWVAITLGILSSIGGFFDMGEIVVTAEVGARFGLSLVWVVVLGGIGIILYAEMAGRIATVSQRPVFDLVRERLGPNAGMFNLIGNFVVVVTTLVAEIAGVALAFELVTSVNYLLWAPLAALIVWLIIWKVQFQRMERIIGIVGMAMTVFAVALWKLGPDWGTLVKEILVPRPPAEESLVTWSYFAVALFGASMTPYEVIFYSSGAVEERWTREDLIVNRGTATVGFTVGGIFAVCAIAVAALALAPNNVGVEDLSAVALGPATALGNIGLAAFIVGLFASTFGAAVETCLSSGYSIAQFFGWRWGTGVKPADDARFHLVLILSLLGALGVVMSTLDPVKVTELSVVASAVALPLTYFPVLLVANDRTYLGDDVNGRVVNFIASFYMFLLVVVAIAAIPLMIWSRMGA